MFEWRGSRSHLASPVSTGRCRISGDNQSRYYLQCPKYGKVSSAGTLEPFLSYLVSGEWVFNLVQVGKMDLEAARAEIIKSAKKLPRLLGNLDKLKLERNSSRLREQIRSIELELAHQEKPCKTIPEIGHWKAEQWRPFCGTPSSQSYARLIRTGWRRIRS